METPDIVIIGGGIMGCSLARELAQAYRKVVVLERGRVGCGASSAAAGLLAPTFFRVSEAGQLVDLCYQSAARYETWLEELRADGAGDVSFRRPGILDVWTDAARAEQKRRDCEAQARPERRVEFLEPQEVRRREPALVGPIAGAAFYPDHAVVDPARLTQAVAGAAERAGVVFREHEPVRQLVREGERIVAVHTATACYRPGLVVLTAGAWTGPLADLAGLKLPTMPVKGQMLLADCRTAPVRGPLFVGEALFIPQPDGRLTLGSTSEHAGFDDRVTLGGLRQILAQACAVMPAVGGLPLVRAWAGLRPGTPDGWPYLGPVPPLRNLWVCAGHVRKGILLAPLCARLLTQSLLADRLDAALVPFQPTRRILGRERNADETPLQTVFA